jgi:Flp pilus assembly pilin Flp
MKNINSQKTDRRGIAMTEYLIILAVVAVAAILVVGLFGQQIKNTFSRNTAAMAGDTQGNATAKTTEANSQAASSQDNMGQFDANASKTHDGGQ